MSPHRTRRRIPDATVARLPIYLQLLGDQLEAGVSNLSSEDLATLAGVNAAKVRKDLSYLGSYGTRGVGYEVQYLVYQIRRELGLDHDWNVVILGAGNLGQALSGYGGFTERGYPIAGIFDVDPDKVDTVVGGVRVRPLDDLAQVVAARSVSIGVIATPPAAAQDAADRLVRSGVTSILNFAPTLVTAPLGVTVRTVDMAVEMQILSYHEQRRALAASSLRSVPGDAGRNQTA
ncbi:MAG: redox-sensing transcriptional repressor Rex [Actinomycetota bacterium]|jgi:redox-sensing transcriptional repressor|nr:redox-sensing transcriptional repressor Rex [Actinomycetota bacterium]MDA3014239.1 redox-sensing transcriptional repressor Rex [Actinomycetota bacterium]MDA3027921.1 redox-sensing transcriptional repressor Rex [Actinomycetota bacterium]